MSKNFKKVIDSLHGGIAVYQPDEDRFVFQYCSESIANLFGCPKTAQCRITDKNALDIVCESDRETVKKALWEAPWKREPGSMPISVSITLF